MCSCFVPLWPNTRDKAFCRNESRDYRRPEEADVETPEVWECVAVPVGHLCYVSPWGPCTFYVIIGGARFNYQAFITFSTETTVVFVCVRAKESVPNGL